MNKFLLSFLGFLLLVGSSYAQTQVTGTVTDAFGPVPGAAVILQGTSVGVTTNVEGNFSINVPDPQTAVLEIKFLGMRDELIPLQGRISGIEVRLTETANQLDEVVVIGYGTEKRGNVAGAMSSVSGEVLARAPVANVAEAMVGKMSGVQVTSVDGSPDAEIMIRVRGGGSLTQDNSPLILVDGFEVNSINDVPPNDIQSLDVLKDAAATAIYGARGANGVVLITTKQPKEGSVSISVNSYM
ncbi:MAG: TonB-dependent receptor plug domain-containing protein, partial [Rikenellaceae bacterium]|nr:TonB-dependent receptor plug domain-containing protein [Rikenellaceae bacterium]